MLVLSEPEIRELVTPADARDATRHALLATQRGAVRTVPPFELAVGDRGEAHGKGAYLPDEEHWALKVASSFRVGADRSSHLSGLSLLFDAHTGGPRALLLDNGYLTELRTGAAGALAAELLCRPDATTLVVVGTGSQARFQLDALVGIRRWTAIRVVGRRLARARDVATSARDRHGVVVDAVADAPAAVADADLVVTTTRSRQPVLRGAWLRPGTLVIGVGTDTPDKRELDADVLRRAAVIAVDDVEQASRRGEARHALDEGLVRRSELTPLAHLIAGEPHPTRRGDIAVTDLTGLGAQDTAIALTVVRRADERGVGVRYGSEAAGMPARVAS